ncbi:hypothetical protein MJO52_11805 [Microbulbifer variabilis]|uniref:Holin of 3TMs, for gene-transfer release n=1 Tax=Microbulbifer variabilis TaxID=266805 RepID=A0ABY4V6H2_9GAMM|nr:hypothetical protein [Microbulbifer variabilis]USD19767.1 hypothetical protein MJO52_11805 [Microbulbifer variabilis]
MKLKEILKAAGGMTLDIFAPGARQIINAVLPRDKQLPPSATGIEAKQSVRALPPEQRASLLERQVDLQIAQEEGWTSRYRAMCQADGQSSRAQIALMMAKVLCFEILAFTLWAFVYPEQMQSPVLWTVFGTLTGVPATLLGKYFGELRREQNKRQESMGASPSAGLVGGIVRALGAKAGGQ